MSRWKHVRSAAVGGAAVVAVWAAVALAAPAQNPIPAPKLDFTGVKPPPPAPPEKLPEIEFADPNVEPAQFKERSGAIMPLPVGRGGSVPDPPHPVVRILVRVPADSTPGEDIKYTITVQNVSAADAHSVVVRNPLSAEVEAVAKAEPTADTAPPGARQVTWTLGTLKAGASKTLELTLRHKPGATELKNMAYVRFEHGQAVTTKIGKPTIKVSKSAPKQTVRDEPFAVRLLVENAGKVPVENVRVLETVPTSAEVEAVTAGAKKVPQAESQQWEWVIPKMQPGERRVIEYRVTPRDAKELLATTAVAAPKAASVGRAEARTAVLIPGLEVKLTGPPPTGVVNAGESAKYEVVVRNTGTLPSTNVKVTATIPADCRPTRKTEGGQIFRDSLVWQVPRLEPGEAQSFRYELKANTTGRRVVTATAADARGMKHAQELATVFAGAAALVWETKFDAVTVRAGRQGSFTVKVRNVGGEPARDVRLTIDVPDNVSVVKTSPEGRVEGNALSFGAQVIPGYGELTYVVTFEGKKADQAWFGMRLAADCLGDRPMKTQKMVEVLDNPR